VRLADLWRVSLRQVWRHRRRYWAVVLAIALGTAGLITLVTMGREVKNHLNQDLDLIGGVTVVRLRLDNNQAEAFQWFRPAAAAAVKALPGVQEVSRLAVGRAPVTWRGQQERITVLAVDGSFWKVRGFQPLYGILFGPQAVSGRQRVCVTGSDRARKLFGRKDVVGLSLEVHHDLYKIVGVLEESVPEIMRNAVFLPLTTARDRVPGIMLPDRLYVRCRTWDDVPAVASAIPRVVGQHQSDERLLVEINWDRWHRVVKMAWWVEFFVYAAVGVTLLLGTVGIWNIMMAVVRSRTREIGLKKAMGAEDSDILAQFLAEALCLSLGAGLVGVAIGAALVEILGLVLGLHPPAKLFLLSVGLSLALAVLIGVGAGLLPSVQASRMNVVEATRYE